MVGKAKCRCGGQWTTFRRWVSPSIIWILEMKLQPAQLQALLPTELPFWPTEMNSLQNDLTY